MSTGVFSLQTVRHYHGHLSACYDLDLHPTIDVLVTCGRDATVRVSDRPVSLLFSNVLVSDDCGVNGSLFGHWAFYSGHSCGS